MEAYDFIVCGLGAFGSSALHELSRRPGVRALGLDAREPASPDAGSFGQTRLLRRSYFEGEAYIPLITRSLELWRELSAGRAEPWLEQSGLSFVFTPPSLARFHQILELASRLSLPIHALSADEARRQLPFLDLPSDCRVLFEEDACTLFSERAIRGLVDEARLNGAEVGTHSPLISFFETETDVQVTTASGTYLTKNLLLTAGAWCRELVPELKASIALRESCQFWFPENPELPPVRGAFAIDLGEEFLYGFSDQGSGIKAASYFPGRLLAHPEDKSTVAQTGLAALERHLPRFFPGVSREPQSQHACVFDLGPGDNLLVDFHPKSPARRVALIAAGSGHGFKMAPALARGAIRMLLEKRHLRELEFLRLPTKF